MPVIIVSKQRYRGTVTPSDLNVETDVINLPDQGDDYVVEGYIDLSQLQEGDCVLIKEYIAVDGANQRSFITAKFCGVQQDPVIRFHSKEIPYDGKYRVTITQTTGVLRTFPYVFIVLVQGTTE
ncbi:MAG: hypothetical protein J7M38_00660 [Armatimonadetes bacterium]|nr:hypothetical protein [Armatimonadota bacterium]